MELDPDILKKLHPNNNKRVKNYLKMCLEMHEKPS